MLCFFFKQKTAYEIVSRDWSSDVCSSDLVEKIDVQTNKKIIIPRYGDLAELVAITFPDSNDVDRKSVVQGKSVDLGGRRIIKKKKCNTTKRRGLVLCKHVYKDTTCSLDLKLCECLWGALSV